jgi:hypothetical protein
MINAVILKHLDAFFEVLHDFDWVTLLPNIIANHGFLDLAHASICDAEDFICGFHALDFWLFGCYRANLNHIDGNIDFGQTCRKKLINETSIVVGDEVLVDSCRDRNR